jgi:hypothetical protein
MKMEDNDVRQLFFCSTEIRVGNGVSTPFWEARWLEDTAPKDLAPNLFNIAKFKSRSVSKELLNSNWIRNLGNVDSETLVEEFTMLFMALSNINLNDQQDTKTWRWTPNGKYTVASAYERQFCGSIALFPAGIIWKAATESKCKFFVWLVLHDRVLTSHNLIKRNWPCNPDCPLCLCFHETNVHLITDCNFTEAVWNLAQHHDLPPYATMSHQGGPEGWVRFISSSGTKNEKRKKLGLLFTFWWGICKARKNVIFSDVSGGI